MSLPNYLNKFRLRPLNQQEVNPKSDIQLMTGMNTQVLVEKMKTQLSKAKDWSENNKGLVAGAAAGVGIGALIGLIALTSRKGKAAGRAGRGKREGRRERRALETDARGGLDLDFDADFDAGDFLEFLESLSPDEFDLAWEE
jgi:hypothetical protein